MPQVLLEVKRAPGSRGVELWRGEPGSAYPSEASSLWRTELGSSALSNIPLNTGKLIGNRCQAVGVKYRHLTKCQPFPWATMESSILILTRELGTSLLHMLVAWLDPEGPLTFCKISSQMTAPKNQNRLGVFICIKQAALSNEPALDCLRVLIFFLETGSNHLAQVGFRFTM